MIGMFSELRVGILAAEKLELKIVSVMKTVFKLEADNKIQEDFTVFEGFMYKLSELCFVSGFTTVLQKDDALRVLDFALIFGFDVFHRMLLTLLEEYESFIISSLKAELKKINMKRTVDTMLVASYQSLEKLFRKAGKLKIEAILKKITKNRIYKGIKRSDFLFQAHAIENSYNYRLARIIQTREIILDSRFGVNQYKTLCTAIDELSESTINRLKFIKLCEIHIGWTAETALNCFNTLDIKGKDTIDKSETHHLLPLFLESTENQIEFAFFLQEKLEISAKEFLETLILLENFFDQRKFGLIIDKSQMANSIVNKIGKLIYRHEIVELVEFSPICRRIHDFLVILNQSRGNSSGARMADIHLNGDYTETSSRRPSDYLSVPLEAEINVLHRKKSRELVEIGDLELKSETESVVLNVNSIESKSDKEQMASAGNWTSKVEEREYAVEVPYMIKDKIQRTCGRMCNSECSIM
jgi:hypothetical protein